MANLSQLGLAGVLLGLLALAYLGLAITVIDYQPPGLGPILAGVMVTAGLFGLVIAWRTVRGAAERRLPIAAAAVLGGLHSRRSPSNSPAGPPNVTGLNARRTSPD